MGRMHLQRMLEMPGGPRQIVAAETNCYALRSCRFDSMARARVELIVLNPSFPPRLSTPGPEAHGGRGSMISWSSWQTPPPSKRRCRTWPQTDCWWYSAGWRVARPPISTLSNDLPGQRADHRFRRLDHQRPGRRAAKSGGRSSFDGFSRGRDSAAWTRAMAFNAWWTGVSPGRW